MEPGVSCWSQSDLELAKCETTFTIKHARMAFQSSFPRPKLLHSDTFNAGENDTNLWCLFASLSSNSLDVFLKNFSKYYKRDAEFSISILDSEGYKRNIRTHQQVPWSSEHSSYYCSDFIEAQMLLEDEFLLPNGNLTLHCEVTTLVETAHVSSKGNVEIDKKFAMPLNTMERQLEKMLHEGKYADVIIEVGEHRIKAHRNILAMRSPVFAAMFDSEPKTKTGRSHVVIADLDYEIVSEMLHYIYTDKAPNLRGMAHRMLRAADEYSLDGLKVLCEKALYDTVSVDNVAELLAMADLYDAPQLKQYSNKFLQENVQ